MLDKPRDRKAEQKGRLQDAMAIAVDYVSRDAVSNDDARRLELAQELARYCLKSFTLQTSENPEAVRLRNICYCILRTKGHELEEVGDAKRD